MWVRGVSSPASPQSSKGQHPRPGCPWTPPPCWIGQAAGLHPHPPRTVLQGAQRAHCSQPFPTLLRIHYCKSFQPAVFFALPSLPKSDKLVHTVSTLNLQSQ